MEAFYLLCLLFVGFQGISAQVLSLGRCPALKAKQNFDANKYLGKWYEQERYFAIFEIGGKCVTAKYTLKSDGKIGVFNEMRNQLSGNLQSIEGFAEFSGSSTEGKLAVTFPSVPFTARAPYWVMETDYNNFAIVWGCQEWFGVINTQTAWILTRAQYPDTGVFQDAYTAATKAGINRALFLKTDQKNCPQN